MTSKNFIALVILSAVLISGCGEATKQSDTANRASEKIETSELSEAEVNEALESLRSYVEKNDREGLQKTFSDDYLQVNPDGKTVTKSERMVSLKSGVRRYDTVEFRNSRIRIYGNTAIIVTNVFGKGTSDGKETKMDMTATIVFVKSADGVREVSAHLTNREQS